MADRSYVPYDTRTAPAGSPGAHPAGDVDPEVGIFCNPALNARVWATPMQLGAYLDLRGWSKIDPAIDLQKEGYLIERPDMGPPNHPDYPFFIAWLSKNQFERFYERGVLNELNHLTQIPRGKDIPQELVN